MSHFQSTRSNFAEKANFFTINSKTGESGDLNEGPDLIFLLDLLVNFESIGKKRVTRNEHN